MSDTREKTTKRDLAKAATRRKAIDAATVMWAEPGSYEKNGIREIAGHMGMSTGAVFANFEGKAHLWTAAFPGVPVPVDSALTRAAPELACLVVKLQAVFADYAEMHRRKLGSGLTQAERDDVMRKIERNRDLSDECLAVLTKVG